MSPPRKKVTPRIRASSTTLALLAVLPSPGPVVGESGSGHTGSSVTSPICRVSAYGAARVETPYAAVAARTSETPSGGSCSRVTQTAPTRRPSRTPASPVTWSAWKCVSTTSGTSRTPSPSRQVLIGRGSGPASTTTAVCAMPVLRTRPSPWPTSQTTINQPDGGQPGVGTRTRTTTTISTQHVTPVARRARSRGVTNAVATHAAVSTASATGPDPQETAAVG